jgi:hypothetical protein
VVIALGTHANKQGRVAGIDIGGGYASHPELLEIKRPAFPNV